MEHDFIGFSFDGIHSSKLNILRVSEGDRYEEELFPEAEDLTIEIPGNEGSYYFDSYFQPRNFSISIAFDSMTEAQFRKMRRLFGTKKICELIFDERPYKVYMAKVASPIQLSYICFDERAKVISDTARNGVRRDRENDSTTEESFSETIIIPANDSYIYKLKHTPIGEVDIQNIDNYSIEDNIYTFTNETDEDIEVIVSYNYEVLIPAWEQITPYIYSNEKERIYKGEGTIEFICYYPFAKSLFKVLDFYNNGVITDTIYDNVNEWKESSGILTQAERNEYMIDIPQFWTSYGAEVTDITVYNPGDLDAGFYLYLPFINNQIEPAHSNTLVITGSDNSLVLDTITSKDESHRETGVIINTVNHLVEGVIFDPLSEQFDGRTPTWKRTGYIYNEHIKHGDFFKIKRNDWSVDNQIYTRSIRFNYLGKEGETNRGIYIYYDYLYF